MRELLLVRFGEVFLKGHNRNYFFNSLVTNIRAAVKPIGAQVTMVDSRILVTGMPDMQDCIERVCRVFGVHSVSPAWELDKDMDEIYAQAEKLIEGRTGTFKIEARRSDKRFPLDSMEIGREVGHYVLEHVPGLTVDVHHPEHKLNIEVRDKAYMYIDSYMGAGGMPLGTGGRAALLLSGGIDSPVAGYMLMKRGVTIEGVHFYSFPYTSERAKEKVLSLGRLLARYSGTFKIHIVPFTKIQMEIHEKTPDEMGTIMMRRFMMRIAERIAVRRKCQALITGESVGQVASQTMESLICTDAVVNMPVFRPVIGMDKVEIIDIANKIGTYETSIEPYEDCCTVFTPRRPVTHPRLDKVEAAESAMDIDGLIAEALAGVETIVLEPDA